MRHATQGFLVLLILLVVAALYNVSTLLRLLVEDGAADAISPQEMALTNSTRPGDVKPQLIPKIIHHTYANDTVPERWKEPWQSCQDMHPDYEIKVSQATDVTRPQLADPTPALDRRLGA